MSGLTSCRAFNPRMLNFLFGAGSIGGSLIIYAATKRPESVYSVSTPDANISISCPAAYAYIRIECGFGYGQ